MNKITVFDIANYFLSKDNLTPKKLQKLVYYAYAWFIALNNEDVNEVTNVLFDEQPEAWIHGPVFPSLYDKYKGYNWNEIQKIDNDSCSNINNDLKAFPNDVWIKFGKFSADQLEYMTHQEEPWAKARKNISSTMRSNEKISKEDIFNYYNGLISA